MQQDANAYAARGFSGIGLYRRKLEDFGLERTIDLLAELSLGATSLSWVGGFTGSGELGFDDAVVDAIHAVRDTANLQAGTLIVLAGGQNRHIRNHARNTVCKALKRISAVAEEFGVRLSLEPFHPGCGEEWSFVNDLKTTLEIVEAVDSPSLGIVLDTYHVGMNDDVVGWLPDVIPHIHLVQLGDAKHSPLGEMNRCLLGEGMVPIQSILSMLGEHGYEGALEVELIGEDVECIPYEAMLDHSKAFLDQSPDLVRS